MARSILAHEIGMCRALYYIAPVSFQPGSNGPMGPAPNEDKTLEKLSVGLDTRYRVQVSDYLRHRRNGLGVAGKQ